MKPLHKCWKHQCSILSLLFQNLWPVSFLDGFKTASRCVFLKGIMQFWNTSGVGCFPPCPTWVPVSSCLALFLDSTDPFLRSMRHQSADDQGVILNAREISGCEWKLTWAFQIEHVPLIRHTEVKVLFLSTCTHMCIHMLGGFLSASIDQLCEMFCFFNFFFSFLCLGPRLPAASVRVLTFFLRIVSSFYLSFINSDVHWHDLLELTAVQTVIWFDYNLSLFLCLYWTFSPLWQTGSQGLWCWVGLCPDM